MRIELLTPGKDTLAPALADVLVDCVAGGSSVGFLDTVTHEEAAAWWRGALQDTGARTWVARRPDGRVVGVVRLVLVAFPNGRHRAEVAKLLVHREARGRGVAAALLAALEDEARRLGRTTLVLDTEVGNPAEGVYARRGWRPVGVIEDYATTPRGEMASTTFMVKHLVPVRSGT